MAAFLHYRKILPRIAWISLSFGFLPIASQALEPLPICPSNFHAFVSTSKIRPDAGFEEISAVYKELRQKHRSLFAPEVDGRRFVNEVDWASQPEKPWNRYGNQTILDWHQGLRFVQKDADNLPLDLEIFKRVHKITTRNMPFHGFEGRRIRALYNAGSISQDEFRRLLKRAYENNEEVSGISHESLRGVLRSSPIDQIWHSGSSKDPVIGRYFTQEELTALRKNPHLRVDEGNLKQVKPGVWEGRVYYTDTVNVESAMNKVLKDTNEILSSNPDAETALRAIVNMEMSLISIHPFLDGNGRTIRLVGDLLRQRHNLPPPLYPNEKDLTMSIDEVVNFQRQAMIEYINSWQDRINRSRKGKGKSQ